MECNFTICITTKNRWEDLRLTLLKIREHGWHQVPLLIYDDFSDEPCPFDAKEIISQVEIKRFTESGGLITRRNQMAEAIATPYYLSLDDDSFPVSGSIEGALRLISSRSDIFCIAFPIFNPIINEYQVASLATQPYQVRSFIGCAHLLDVAKLKSLNGYREELIHQGEELEIAIRAYKQGWKCYHHPGLLIHHHMSLNGRSWERMDYYGARNNILWNDWYLPRRIKYVGQAKNIISRIVLSIKLKRKGQLNGIVDAFKNLRSLKKFRQELSFSEYQQWRELPGS